MIKIMIKAFGPEITKFLAGEHILNIDANSTIDDLARKLEEEIKAKYGWAPNILHSNFTVLVNGRHVETLHDHKLKDGDTVALISPIGGG